MIMQTTNILIIEDIKGSMGWLQNIKTIAPIPIADENKRKMKGFLKIMAIMIMETIITPIKKSNTPTSTLGFLSYIEQRPRKPR